MRPTKHGRAAPWARKKRLRRSQAEGVFRMLSGGKSVCERDNRSVGVWWHSR